MNNRENETLSEQLGQLSSEISPKHDLWRGIAEKIANEVPKQPINLSDLDDGISYSHPRRPVFNMPLSLAASLLIAISAIGFSWHSLDQVNHLTAQQAQLAQNRAELARLHLEYSSAKSTFLEQLGTRQVSFDSAVMSDITNNIAIIEQAIEDIKAELVLDPSNQQLWDLLRQTYAQQDAIIRTTKRSLEVI